jgi:hypothetical protein
LPHGKCHHEIDRFFIPASFLACFSCAVGCICLDS